MDLKTKLIVILLPFWLPLNKVYSQVVQGDNLGSHLATQQMNMNGKNVINASGIIIGASAFTGANSSIALEINGTNKALLLPRVSNLSAITSPLAGMLVYNSTDNRVYIYQENSWVTFSSTNLPNANILIGDENNIPQPAAMSGDVTLTNAGVAAIGTGKVNTLMFAPAAVTSAKIANSTVSTIDIADAAITAPLITASNVTTAKIADSAITTTKIADNTVSTLKINAATSASSFLSTNATGNTNWTAESTFPVRTIASSRILVGNASSVATAVAMSGDVTIANTGATTIGADKVTAAKLQAGSVNRADLADNSVPAVKMAAVVNNAYLTTNGSGVNAWNTLPVENYAIGDVKIWMPDVMMIALPEGWVECNGQTLSYPGSTLNGKVIPNLNNNNYLVGNNAATATSLGANSVVLTRDNLPNTTFTNNTLSSSAQLNNNVTGSVSIANDAGHSHGTVDPGHIHGSYPYNPGGVYPMGSFLRSNLGTANYSPTTVSTTGISLYAVGTHNHTATFSGAPAMHTHPVNLSSINGGVTQTAVPITPKSVTVRWIMRVI